MKHSTLLCALISVAAVSFSPLASAQTTVKGGVLTDADGKTLYIFDKDAGGVSACYDGCAVNWPPFLAKPDAAAKGNLTLVARKDGQKQWAASGKPLYYFAGDAKPGDTNGDGKGGVWHVVK
jgi:predicted lipoprotein with Yx(FWY)xxD motif